VAETSQGRAATRYSCGRCPATWTGQTRAHCAAPGCHRTFSGASTFDQHRSQAGEHGSCTDPATVVNSRTGERLLFERDGIWSGPEMTDEQKAAAFGGRAA
jgi:hypothetical protein